VSSPSPRDEGVAVQKGQSRIAQRFNAGLDAKRSRVPQGRLRPNPTRHPSAVPPGLVSQAGCFPALKRRAILAMSLRDKGTRPSAFPQWKEPNSSREPLRDFTSAVSSQGERAGVAAFTLVELLVVIAIIGLLATIGLPALKGFGKGTGMAGAQRQLLQDLGLARLSAINGRTTVYIVFVPTNILDRLLMPATPANTLRQLTNLLSGQYTAYALLTKRSAGDQPGQGSPRYISEWRRLPPGILFPPVKFDQAALNNDPSLAFYPVVYKTAFLTNALPFPTGKSPLWPLPYVAFNSKGQLVSGRDEMIPLAEGSIFFARNNQGMVLAPPDVVIKPPNNYTNRFIRVNWLTGRASVDEGTRPKFR